MCVYIPSSLVLFKLMRACVGVEDVKELWIYNHKEEKEKIIQALEHING